MDKQNSATRPGHSQPPGTFVGKTIVGFLALLAFVLTACYRESTIPVVAGFAVEVADNNYTVPVTLAITNQTTGAEWYKWEIDGGSTYSSTQEDPGRLTIDQSGTHTITLTAGNQFEQQQKSVSVTLDALAQANFTAEVITNNFAPATVKLTNTTVNGEQFAWHFPGAQTESSTDKTPAPVFYTRPGKYTISLDVTTGRKTYTKQQEIEVLDSLKTNFDYTIGFIDQDMEVPVTVYFEDKSTNATSRLWTFEGGLPAQSAEANPIVTFTEPGTHRVQLACNNQKTEQSKTVGLQLFANTGLQTFRNVELGIFSARNATGSFFSFSTGKVYKETELSTDNITSVDLVYFGFSSDFKLNRFVSPADMANYGFIPFTTGKSAVFYNSTELCSCNFKFTASDFDAIQSGGQLNGLNWSTLDIASQKQFNGQLLPRLVPFVTSDGRKGIIRIIRFVSDGDRSYIITDIKVEKPHNK
jgi:PKD repeat protein